LLEDFDKKELIYDIEKNNLGKCKDVEILNYELKLV